MAALVPIGLQVWVFLQDGTHVVGEDSREHAGFASFHVFESEAGALHCLVNIFHWRFWVIHCFCLSAGDVEEGGVELLAVLLAVAQEMPTLYGVAPRALLRRMVVCVLVPSRCRDFGPGRLAVHQQIP
ncbi:lovastatin nonaketide synthase [Colletotrichum asianum]